MTEADVRFAQESARWRARVFDPSLYRSLQAAGVLPAVATFPLSPPVLSKWLGIVLGALRSRARG